jgi:hypothetical protein
MMEKPPFSESRDPVTMKLLNRKPCGSSAMKPYGRRFLVFERRPTVSGGREAPVGGEILPVNSLQLLLVNLWWIFLLAIPLLIYFLNARYGMRIPRHLRLALRLFPIVAHSL